jgi:hypothetical protein
MDGSEAKLSKNARARSTNRLQFVPGLDLRSHAARRYRDLIAAFTDALGGTLSDAQQVAVQRAAGLTVAAEEARAKAMCGESISIANLVKSENAADRAVQALNIRHEAERPPTSAARPGTFRLDECLARP